MVSMYACNCLWVHPSIRAGFLNITRKSKSLSFLQTWCIHLLGECLEFNHFHISPILALWWPKNENDWNLWFPTVICKFHFNSLQTWGKFMVSVFINNSIMGQLLGQFWPFSGQKLLKVAESMVIQKTNHWIPLKLGVYTYYVGVQYCTHFGPHWPNFSWLVVPN